MAFAGLARDRAQHLGQVSDWRGRWIANVAVALRLQWVDAPQPSPRQGASRQMPLSGAWRRPDTEPPPWDPDRCEALLTVSVTRLFTGQYSSGRQTNGGGRWSSRAAVATAN